MRKLQWTLAAFFLIFGIVTAAVAQEESPASDADIITALDAFAAEQMADWNIPGMALAVVRGEEVIYEQGYGRADDAGRTVTPETPFWLASVSKSITATAVMQLVEAGQIDLDAPVSDVISWFREGMDDPTPITPRHLLNQTSGFSTYTGVEVIADLDVSDSALERNAHRLSSAPLLFEPGTDFKYSNSNFDMLGYLVQVVSGQSYESYIQDHIFTPLDMAHSYTMLADAQTDGMTEGYYPFFGSPMQTPTMFSRAITPSAGLIASAEDLSHYVIAHLNGGSYNGESILSPNGIAALHRSAVDAGFGDSYAMGWFVSPILEAAIASDDAETLTVPVGISHNGGWHNFRSFIWLVPDQQLGVIVLINTADFAHDSAYNSIAYNLTLLAMGKDSIGIAVYEDVFTQNARWIGLAILLIWVYRLIRSIWLINHWRRVPAFRPKTLGGKLRAILLPLMLDIVLTAYVFLGVPLQYESPLQTILNFNPDLRIILLGGVVLAVGWGLIRTVLYVLALNSSVSQKA